MGNLTCKQMVTVEVTLNEGDAQPEQHLDDGEHIERVVVPLSELYEKLQGTFSPLSNFAAHFLSSLRGGEVVTASQRSRKTRARSWTPGTYSHSNLGPCG